MKRKKYLSLRVGYSLQIQDNDRNKDEGISITCFEAHIGWINNILSQYQGSLRRCLASSYHSFSVMGGYSVS